MDGNLPSVDGQYHSTTKLPEITNVNEYFENVDPGDSQEDMDISSTDLEYIKRRRRQTLGEFFSKEDNIHILPYEDGTLRTIIDTSPCMNVRQIASQQNEKQQQNENDKIFENKTKETIKDTQYEINKDQNKLLKEKPINQFKQGTTLNSDLISSNHLKVRDSLSYPGNYKNIIKLGGRVLLKEKNFHNTPRKAV